MFIISPKWIYFGNRKIESGKSLLIDGSVIVDILTNDAIEKKFKKIPRIHYKDHLMLPTFSECFIDVSDCTSQDKYIKKLTNLLNNGVTKVQVVSGDYERVIKYDTPLNMNVCYKIILDSSECKYDDIKSMLKTLDFYKSDPQKLFSIDLRNITCFEKDLVIKIASICNELNLSIDIHLSELTDISDKEVNNLFKFWDEINLTNNCVMHDFLQITKFTQKYIKKNNNTISIRYSDLHNVENITLFLSLMKNKYKCVLVSESGNTYMLYDLLKSIYFFFEYGETFNKSNIINSVTSYTSQFFLTNSLSGSIQNGALASFNLFDIQSRRLLLKDDCYPLLCDLDNASLTNVWSAGEVINIESD